MNATFVLPFLGESVDQGTVTRWLKRVGDQVSVGEPLIEVATDKVDTEVIATFSGTLTVIHVDENETAVVGQALASFAPAGASTDDLPTVSDLVPAEANRLPGSGDQLPMAALPPEAVAYPTSAPARPSAASAALPNEEIEPLTRIRQLIGERMLHSLRSTAQLTTVVEIDVTRALEARAVFQERGRPASFLSIFARAAIDAIAANPRINSILDDGATRLTIPRSVHLAIAVDDVRGLVVPVIRDAHLLDAPELSIAIADVAARVRSRQITQPELADGTFTITNTGSRGALFDTPILNSPQSAILGIGAIVRRVVPLGDNYTIGIRSFAHFALTYDHRVIDGADAARYLSEIRRLIETAPLA